MRSLSSIAEEMCLYLGRRKDIDALRPVIERRIEDLLWIRSSADQLRNGRATSKLAAEARRDLDVLRRKLSTLPVAPAEFVEPVDLAKLDKGLQWVERVYGSGPDPRSGVLQRICAVGARGLILEFAKQAPKKSSQYYNVAALLYEAMTGKQQSLKRACDAELDTWTPELLEHNERARSIKR